VPSVSSPHECELPAEIDPIPGAAAAPVNPAPTDRGADADTGNADTTDATAINTTAEKPRRTPTDTRPTLTTPVTHEQQSEDGHDETSF